jgi:glycosyltransferase involved in cell wall biosynthesis
MAGRRGAVARLMLRDIVRTLTRRPVPAAPGSVGELVFSGPLPPARTGVATYDRAVLDGLRRIGFFHRHRMDVRWPIEPKDAPRLPGYRLGVFALGNNVEFHLEAYRAAFLAQASLIVLHDLALDDFVRGLRTLGDPLGFMAAREAAALRPNLSSPDVVRNEPLREPWCAHVARRARGIIVHSEFGKRYLEESGCRTPVFVVPHPMVESDADVAAAAAPGRALRSTLEARGARSLIVAPGDLNEAKRLDAVLAAAHELDDAVHLVLVGRRIEGYDIDRVVETAGLGARVTLAADVTDDEFRVWLAAADVVVDLRFPHRGEVSGSLIRAMQAGKPSVVSATGTYLDAPDDAVLRVAPGPTNASELAERIRSLVEDPDLRGRMGQAARAHIDAVNTSEATARGYERAIEETLRLVRDPAHKALAIWGKALADLGADETDLREGLGVGYARALATFRGSS